MKIGYLEIDHTLLLCWPVNFTRCFWSENMTESWGIQESSLTAGSELRSAKSPSLLLRVVWLCLLLFSLLHACHSWRPLMQRDSLRSCSAASIDMPLYFPRPCVMICASLVPQVLRYHHHPSCGCGRTCPGLGNVLYPCDWWHGVTHTQPVHRDGLNGCQWKQRRAGSGPKGCGSRDLHDCFQESLGTGKTPHSSLNFSLL